MAESREELRELLKVAVCNATIHDGGCVRAGSERAGKCDECDAQVDAQLAALADAGVAMVDLAKFDAGLQSGQLPNMRNDVRQIAFAETKAALRNARVDLTAGRIDKP